MKRKTHWIQDLIPVTPRKRARVFVKPAISKPQKSDHWRAKMQDFYSDLNIDTLESVAPYFSTSKKAENYYSIFPHLVLDLYLLKPSLFKDNFKGCWVTAMSTKSTLADEAAFFEQSLCSRVEDGIIAQIEHEAPEAAPAILKNLNKDLSRWDAYVPLPEKDIKIDARLLRAGLVNFNNVKVLVFGTRVLETTADMTCSMRQVTKNEEIVTIRDHSRIGISLLDALLISNILKTLTAAEQNHFLKHWKSVLPFLPEWRMGFEMSSALACSSLSTYMSQLRVFSSWICSIEVPEDMRRECFEHVMYDMKTNKLTKHDFSAYIHTRAITCGSFRTVRSGISALGFFYRQMHGKTLLQMFPLLKNTISALQKRFEHTDAGSIALSFELLQKFLDFILNNLDSDKWDKAQLYNLFILAFWFMLRIGEAARLSFDSAILFTDEVLGIEKLRFTLVHPKTSSSNFPDQFVTCSAIPGHPLCPVEAFKRLKLAALENQRVIFADKNGKAYGATELGNAFRECKKQWQAFCPEAPRANAKLTFHTFRISSIGYHAIELGLSIFEIQAISRHKYGSSVTQDIYLAKSKQIIAEATASKVAATITKLDDPTKTNVKDTSWMQFLSLPTQRIFQTWRQF